MAVAITLLAKPCIGASSPLLLKSVGSMTVLKIVEDVLVVVAPI